MTKPKCHCAASRVVSLITSNRALGCIRCEIAFGHAELVFHVVAGQGEVFGLCCEALLPRSRTDMMGRHISLPATEKCAAALEALVGTYLVVGSWQRRPDFQSRSANLRRLQVHGGSARAKLFLERLRRLETDLPLARSGRPQDKSVSMSLTSDKIEALIVVLISTEKASEIRIEHYQYPGI